MRRLGGTLPELPKASLGTPATAAWRAIFPLRAITPIIGGGVEPGEPDAVDVIRLPAIRGVLRWWWRALYQTPDMSADALFRREVELWGGVDVPADDASDKKVARRSRVRLRCRVEGRGQSVAAGQHLPGQTGKLKAAASWKVPALGYALFPLQIPKLELGSGRQPVDTRSILKDVIFDLSVELATPAEAGAASESRGAEELLGALWAWIHFGGIGARTRRGFGALALSAAPRVTTGQPCGWPWDEGTAAAMERLRRLAAPGSRIARARLLLGPPGTDSTDAHGQVVECLRTFRQAVDYGREKGTTKPQGHSNWPEPNLLRSLSPTRPSSARRDTERSPPGAGVPRAAFGLPLIFQFQDPDKYANATVEAEAGERWASPVLMRPGVGGEGKPRGAILFLGGAGPSNVTIRFGDGSRGPGSRPPRTAVVKASAGARALVERYLTPAGGDAIEAFEQWLTRDQGFNPA